ncbi:glycoside hydrolase superfamily [Cokeromyces recurvatus]|uniref:glycoside hydrolase superfamily n=1 Tax=Cokeromyces recurvatus TaxID=90255 RepID=UPI00221E63AF|nr:glycoside hydrolase superfamily [Cokeromyces recurvatus]KAI7901938.1 glycoside hydrolase superfamily [Cokeromyces recurvatus]
MKLFWLSIVIYIALISVARAILLWPIPQNILLGETELQLDTKFYISGSDNKYLKHAIKRYTRIITYERWIPVQNSFDMNHDSNSNISDATLKSLDIILKDEHKKLEFGVDESYILNIPVNQRKATLKANTVWGALRGLETFSQLVQSYPSRSDDGEESIIDYDDEEENDDNKNNGFEGLYIPNVPIKIKDSPKYTHRGLMLDTSRNFFPVKDILRTIDAMAFNKMNVFHWHITDSHSFPLKLKSAPEFAHQGAYVLQQKRLTYSKKDIKHIIKYAYKRGVRVIPEIDMPAHTGSWALSHKEITTCTGIHYLDKSNEWGNRLAAEPGTGQLNPVLNETYDLVDKVITEVASLFLDNWYHGGGDEPVYKCWEQDKNVRNYMKTHNVTGIDLLHLFLQKELNIIKNSKKTAILWEDAVTNDNLPISKDVILQVWTNPVQNAIKKGYKVIASNYNFWYLDCGHGGWGGNDTSYDEQAAPEIPKDVVLALDKNNVADNYKTQNWGGAGGDWCSPFKSWQRIYSYDMTYNLTEKESKNVLGGEVAMWTEQVDSTSLDIRLWPRAAAAAEIMWSGRYDKKNKKRDIGDAMPRIFDWRFKLLKRGINTEALQPLWCGQNPHMCDATYPTAF